MMHGYGKLCGTTQDCYIACDLDINGKPVSDQVFIQSPAFCTFSLMPLGLIGESSDLCPPYQ